MSTAVLHRSHHPAPTRASALALTVGILLALWLALVAILGARGAFAQAPGEPPLPIFLRSRCRSWFFSRPTGPRLPFGISC